ncbi:hypothetical protein ACOID8_30990, partial [Klebsiella pneumoniae]|uniref:hypothetical protein n=1 Tax=Klebsiella pneumoniae TaxID=573 RepID=UPI003B5CDEF0
KRAYCLKTQPATGETYPKSDLFNKAVKNLEARPAPANVRIELIRPDLPWASTIIKGTTY